MTSDEFLMALKSFPKGSGAGPDGLRPQHIREMIGVGGETGSNLVNAMCKLIDKILKGEVPNSITPVLFGANLTALRKNNGGNRPIASGSVIRRLCGKIISRRLQVGLGEPFRPIPLGHGTPGGCKIAVHAARAFLAESANGNRCVL